MHEPVQNSTITKGMHGSASAPSQLLPKRTVFCKLSSSKLHERKKGRFVLCKWERRRRGGNLMRQQDPGWTRKERSKQWAGVGRKDAGHWHGVLPGMVGTELKNWKLKKHCRHMPAHPCAVKRCTVRVSVHKLYRALLYCYCLPLYSAPLTSRGVFEEQGTSKYENRYH